MLSISFTILSKEDFPDLPLKTFAFPELISITETFPNLIMIFLFQIIGSPGVFELVNKPNISPGFI